jgi:hypothetical protein
MIEFVCVAAHHQSRPRSGPYVSPLTIHDGKWAYCPASLVTDHEWHAIAAAAIEDVRRQWRAPSAKA